MPDHNNNPQGTITDHPTAPDGPPPSWVDSFVDLVISRIELIGAEARAAVAAGAGRIIRIVVAVLFVAITWLLLMAGIAGLGQALAGIPWYWGCLILAMLHTVTAIILVNQARKPGPPAFQHTRAEFQKDREWIKNLQHPKSKR